MAFFARPNLDDTQFKQLKGSELTLSGQTQIATTTGLTLVGDSSVNIPIQATGATNNFVLTYDDGGVIPVIKLKESSATGATGIYPYNESATTTVGGLVAGENLYNEQVVDILHDILVPTLYPTLTNPSISSFTISPSTTLYEVGYCASGSTGISGITVFNPGTINPQYSALSDCRSCGASGYTYSAFSIDYTCLSSLPTNTYWFGSNTIGLDSNYIYSCVCYSGGTQPYDSSGNTYSAPLVASATTSCYRVITGVYPWYWGTLSSSGASAGVNRPSVACIKHEMTGNTCGGTSGGTKVVGTSTGTIEVIFGSTSDDYLWFATPTGSTSKTCWYVDALNSGIIGGAVSGGGNLFPVPETVTGVTSVGTGSWTGQSYQVYVSNYQSEALSNMELRNS